MAKGIDARTSLLLGDDKLEALQSSVVAVFGLGGVGGTAFEALARSGVRKIYAIDCDVVEPSNLNRQILFTAGDIGEGKAEAAKRRASSIRDDVEVVAESYEVGEDTISEHDYSDVSLFIDAVDDVKAKIAIMWLALSKGVPVISSLGMGNRLDPSKVYLTTLDKTEGDPLARKVRSECRKKGLDLSKILCVVSGETPLRKLPEPASMMMAPSEAGLLIASAAVSILSNRAVK